MRVLLLAILALSVIVPIGVNDVFANDGNDILEIASLEHDARQGQYNSLVQVDSDTYALAYEGKDSDGFISTFTISSDGTSIVEVDTLEHHTDRAWYSSLVQVDSDTYALAYEGGADKDGYISTFTIDSDGTITPIRIQDHASHASASANLEHDTTNGGYNSLVQVDSDTYALAYKGADNDGYISTFTISSSGDITAVKTQSEGNNLEHDTGNGTHNSLLQIDSDTYALAYTSGQKDGWIMTFTIPEEEEEKKGSTCWDCTRPAITHHGHSETPDGFSINDAIFENNQELYNENPTIEATVGDMVTIKARAWDNRGPENIVRVFTYLDMYEEKPNWHESEAYIEYNIKKDKFEVNDKNKIFALVGASSEVAVNPYYEDGKLNRPLELLDITFTIIFAKPMETSHIAIQTIDDAANYELVYFEDALKIKEKEIVEIPEVPEEVIPEVPEVIPEPEPPVKEPEPEVIPTALIKKGVLNFVDDDVPAKHYVKRYITETEYREWFDVNYSEYQFWEGIGITEERFDELIMEIQSEPEPKMIQTGFVLVPDEQESFPLVKETYEPEPAELEPVKEKKGFFDWLFSLLG